ncbi:MAG: hypothetical protein LBS56_07085 [Propionibacteriaceae bacterium]|nr:hypothetical protein [Propionibacteriaceae bacterium]
MSVPTPWPPGAIDRPADPGECLAYLDALSAWLAERRRELDHLDEAIMRLPSPAGPTADMMVALSVWQAIRKRHDELMTTWDSGRVGPVQLRQLAALMWGRLDDAQATPGAAPATAQGLSVNLGEACRLSDALTSQLAATLRLNPVNSEWSLRLDGLRAQAERLRDQVKLEPSEKRAALTALVEDIAADTAELAQKAERGGDIGGSLGPMEIRAATLERDLIVGHAQRRQWADKAQRIKGLRALLVRREESLAELVAKVKGEVVEAPKYAVPHVDALGPLPEPGPALDAYAEKLGRVGRAFDVVEEANRRALTALAQLGDYLRLLRDRVDMLDSPDPTVTALVDQAAQLLARRPAPLEVVKPILAACRAALTGEPDQPGGAGRGARP